MQSRKEEIPKKKVPVQIEAEITREHYRTKFVYCE
jgi:hypothetical protein